jgi:phosphoribosylamine--glycine ligase
MRVLVLGSGGREHALAWAIAQSPRAPTVICTPGSDGIALDARVVPGDASDPDDALRVARVERADLVVVGPEGPLAAGVADRLTDAGFPTVGPARAAAELEWSKVFAKRFMERHGIPTAPYRVFDSADEAERFAAARSGPLVVKADGLAAGKAVAVCDGPEQARLAIAECMRERRFGAAGARVVIEERLVGVEASYYALCCDETFARLPHAQDHKRALDGDRGENTGGMGAFSPAAALDPALCAKVEERIVRPTLAGLRAERRPYRGALYLGLMIVAGEPYVIEYNARLGDPETQAILFRLRGDLLPWLEACAAGKLDTLPGELPVGGPALCVVVASPGYPRDYPQGLRIDGLPDAAKLPDVKVFHAGTRRAGAGWVTAGGRVLGVTARGATLAAARERAYEAVHRIRFDGAMFRSDIGALRTPA